MKENSDAYIIEVDIKPYEKDLQKKLKKQIELTEILNNEYIHKYLSKINAFPTIENIKLVQKHMNIDQALILPDIIREKIVILPNMKNKIKDTEVNELFR
jgi:hypothetical protein